MRNRIIQASLLSVFFVAVLCIFTQGTASAAYCGTGYFTGDERCTDDPLTFDNDVVGPRDAVPEYVYDGVDDQQDLYNWVTSLIDLNTYPSSRNEWGGSFIINTMLGADSPEISQAMVDNLYDRLVLNPNIRVYSTTDDPNNYGNGLISFYSNDDGFFTDYDSGVRGLVVVEDISTGERYVIEIPCANPVGGLSLPDYTPDTLPEFNFNMNCSAISGYAYDPDNTDVKLPVDVYVGGPKGTAGVVKVSVTADINSDDFWVDLTLDPLKKKVANGPQRVYIYTWSYDADGNRVSGPYEEHTAMNGATTVGPCNQASCVPNSSGMPAAMTVGQVYRLKPQVNLASNWGPPMHIGPTGANYDPRMHYTIRYSSDGGTTWSVLLGYNNDTSYDAGFPSAGTRLTANPTNTPTDRGIAFTPTNPGRYAIAWSLTGSGVIQNSIVGTISCGSAGSSTNVPDQGTAGTKPYFSVIGGDIISGGNINAYNQNGINTNGDVDSNAYAGAGSNLAAIAGSTAANFVTGIGLNTGVSTKSGAGLGFANVSLSPNQYAGGFVPLPSIPTVDLSGAHTNWATVANLSTCTTKCIYDVAPGTTISGMVSAGADITLYVATGNIYLGNITYNYSSLDDIPRLTVYTASGNIIVANTATEIHGVFVASGGAVDTSKGRFYSCGTNANNPITYTTVTNQCDSALTVYGAVIANKLILARTPGTYIPGQPNSNPAENFVFGPEVWLHRSTSTMSGGSAAPVFDQYFSLPPVL